MIDRALYIAVSAQRGRGAWAWRCVEATGPWTQASGIDPTASAYRLRIHALQHALATSSPGQMTVHTSDPTLETLCTDWLPRWAAQGWTRRGSDVQDLDVLQPLFEKLASFHLTFAVSSRRTASHAKDAKRLARRAAEDIPESASPPSAPVEVQHPPLRQGLATVVWADGASRGNPGPSGWGYAIVHRPSGVCLHQRCATESSTNNAMELEAVLEALRAIKTDGTRLEVRTDSRFVIDVSTKWRHGWRRRGWRKADGEPPANLALIKGLDVELDRLDVHFTWVRGHTGEPGNEYVDGLANQAIDEMLRGEDSPAPTRLRSAPFDMPR